MKQVKVFEEPSLEFAFRQRLRDPHNGLALFGPYDKDESSKPHRIRWGVIGTDIGILAFKDWAALMNQAIPTDKDKNGKKMDERLWPPYPGFEAAYASKWPEEPVKEFHVDRDELITAANDNDPNKRTYNVADKYISAINLGVEKFDEDFDVFICVIPDEVWRNCRPESCVAEGWGTRPSQKIVRDRVAGQLTLFEEDKDWKRVMYQLSTDFRRQLKARVMKHNVPIQIVRESTLEIVRSEDSERGLTPLADRMWNMSTAIYYKAGGKPWKLSTARDGVSYIGIAFRRTGKSKTSKTACCAAQMFLDSGDGIVFLGDEGPWFSPRERQFHLTKVAAKNLLAGILKTYQEREGKELTEIFLHYRSSINEDEYQGFIEACPPNTKLVGIRVRIEREGIRLYRQGSYPVMRGTFLKLNETSCLLWGTGFKPHLEKYDGWEVPVPLRIDIQHGDSDIEHVAKDILSLTKLNYNACKLGDSEPVTIKFSDAVGEILVSNPGIKERRFQFKFYI